MSLSQNSFAIFKSSLELPARAHLGSFFGWLSAELPLYPRTENLKTRLHLRDGIRPYIELEPTDHPLAVEQRSGMSIDRTYTTKAARLTHARGGRVGYDGAA